MRQSELFENFVILCNGKKYHQENIESSHSPESTLRDSEFWRVSILSSVTGQGFFATLMIG